MKRLVTLCVILGLVSAKPLAGQSAPAMPDSVRRYLLAAFDTLKRVSMHRDTFDWATLRDSVMARAASAKSYEETWPVIQWMLRRVDRHSFLQTPRPMPLPSGQSARPAPRPPPPPLQRRLIDGRYGYVLMPSFGGASRETFVDSARAFIRELDSAGVCGWIVDLRRNGGGNMWPMLAGLAPLLGDTVVGHFMSHGSVSDWVVRDGVVGIRSSSGFAPIARGSKPPVPLADPLAPIAVLTSSLTASSGEATLVAFRGRPNTITMGDTTAGFASINSGYRLPDSANMLITIGWYRDRTGRQYPLAIGPDIRVVSPDSTDDRGLARATAWLSEQGACRSPR